MTQNICYANGDHLRPPQINICINIYIYIYIYTRIFKTSISLWDKNNNRRAARNVDKNDTALVDGKVVVAASRTICTSWDNFDVFEIE